jgi:hypothetical protein
VLTECDTTPYTPKLASISERTAKLMRTSEKKRG